jgi:hypothetical protein
MTERAGWIAGIVDGDGRRFENPPEQDWEDAVEIVQDKLLHVYFSARDLTELGACDRARQGFGDAADAEPFGVTVNGVHYYVREAQEIDLPTLDQSLDQEIDNNDGWSLS